MPKNTGLFAYNVGYSNSAGKYILTLDDDCEISVDGISVMVNYLEKQSESVGIGSLNVYNPISKTYEWHHFLNEKSLVLPTFAGGACVFRKKMLENIGYYDDSFFLWIHEDDLSLRAMSQGYQVHFLRDVVVKHHDFTKILRPKKLFLTFRNRAWLNIKHFSLLTWPLLVVRDILYGGSLAFGQPEFLKRSFFISAGYIWGYLTFFIKLKDRKVVSWSIQKRFLRNFYLKTYQSFKSYQTL